MRTAKEEMVIIKKTIVWLVVVSIAMFSFIPSIYLGCMLTPRCRGISPSFPQEAFFQIGTDILGFAVSFVVFFIYERRRATDKNWEQDFQDRFGWHIRIVSWITVIVILVVAVTGSVPFLIVSIGIAIVLIFFAFIPWEMSTEELEARRARKIEKNATKYLSGCVITRDGTKSTIVLKGVRINGLLLVAILFLALGVLLVILFGVDISDELTLFVDTFVMLVTGLIAITFVTVFYCFASKTVTMHIDRALKTCTLEFRAVFKLKYRTITLSFDEIKTILSGDDVNEAIFNTVYAGVLGYRMEVKYIFLVKKGGERIKLLRVPDSASNYHCLYLSPIVDMIRAELSLVESCEN